MAPLEKRAKLSFLEHAITPFGPEWLDHIISKALGLKGDFLIEFRTV
ncbi:hypothetical protein D1AOALGA4SA_11519 [Olavius algarvensis Delta 1 endosymbiont]|nr:hypothetical protein D1AOALGA4SA_11519 [Olavius algarvensis Delta 1 endosymbiont]